MIIGSGVPPEVPQPDNRKIAQKKVRHLKI